MNWIPAVQHYILRVVANVESLASGRRELLSGVAQYIGQRAQSGKPAKLVFICTHNSRRSHLGEVFCRIALCHFGIPGVVTASGGTEVTACHPNTLAALERAGLRVLRGDAPANPVHEIFYAESEPAIHAYSKRFDAVGNTDSPFAAMMCCDHADQACPVIPGADDRFALQYQDPKVADGSETESQVYDERCFEIATEMFAMASMIKTAGKVAE
ncbi:MAG: protein-tyrosine-phosphatase [Planctomycetota bacterium]